MLRRKITTAFLKSLRNNVTERRVKLRDCGNVRFPPPSAEIKNTWISTAIPP